MRVFWAFSIILISLLIFGCATVDPTGPRNEREAFPIRNQDPRWGLVINEGSAHLNIFVYDEAGRVIEQGYMAGVNRFFTINGQNMPRYWVRQLPIGNYRIELYPFYYQTDIVAPLLGRPARYRVDLPKQTASISVGRNPTANYDYGSNIGGTYRHWGWICKLNGGYVPDTAMSILPGIKINLQGNFR